MNIAATRRRGVEDATNDSMAPLGEVLAAFETKLAVYPPNITGSSSVNQQRIPLGILAFAFNYKRLHLDGLRAF